MPSRTKKRSKAVTRKPAAAKAHRKVAPKKTRKPTTSKRSKKRMTGKKHEDDEDAGHLGHDHKKPVTEEKTAPTPPAVDPMSTPPDPTPAPNPPKE